MDLRERVISAVEGGLSRRSAAKLFSVTPLTAIKGGDQKRRTGSAWPQALGGDHRSHCLEAHADEIVTSADNSDMTLAELASFLNETHGVKVAKSTIWR
ncbi:MAG: IS630 family transposase, partial [Geminicoccaceae bacterium]